MESSNISWWYDVATALMIEELKITIIYCESIKAVIKETNNYGQLLKLMY